MFEGFATIFDGFRGLFGAVSKATAGECWARAASIAGKARVNLSKHRDRNVDLRRNAASTLKSKQARILDKRLGDGV